LARAGIGRRRIGDQFAQFLASDEMAGAELAELALVEQRQPGGEQLAVDDALGEAGGDAETGALRQLGQRLVDALLVAARRRGGRGS
jgi:hypothetical protein